MAHATLATGGQTLENLVGGTLARKASIAVLGSIFMAAMTQVSVPFFPVPMTLQTLAVMLIGVTFGFRLAAATLALYLVEGMVGLPVFSNFGFGLAKIMGPTGGYLIGFLAAAAAMGLLADRGATKSWPGLVLSLLVGEVLIFGFGVAYLASLIGLEKALVGGLYPFLLAEILKMALAALIGTGVLAGAARFSRL